MTENPPVADNDASNDQGCKTTHKTSRNNSGNEKAAYIDSPLFAWLESIVNDVPIFQQEIAQCVVVTPGPNGLIVDLKFCTILRLARLTAGVRTAESLKVFDRVDVQDRVLF